MMSWFLATMLPFLPPATAAEPPVTGVVALATAADETTTPAPGPANPDEVDAARRAAAEDRYLQGLAAWKKRDWQGALDGARAALALDDEMEAAQLLEAYSLLRLHRVEEGVGALRGLADAGGDDATSREVQRRAGNLERRISDRWRRDQVSLSVSNLLSWERSFDQLGVSGGPTVDVQVPFGDRYAVRVETTTYWGLANNRDLDVRGPTVAPLAVGMLPLGRGVWTADAAVGPVLWYARGGYWEDGSQVFVGLRAAVGTDVRLSRRFGLRAEVGTRWYPFKGRELDWYGQPLDTRLAAEWWFGGGDREARGR